MGLATFLVTAAISIDKWASGMISKAQNKAWTVKPKLRVSTTALLKRANRSDGTVNGWDRIGTVLVSYLIQTRNWYFSLVSLEKWGTLEPDKYGFLQFWPSWLTLPLVFNYDACLRGVTCPCPHSKNALFSLFIFSEQYCLSCLL